VHEWACFAAHQGAANAVKALHLNLGQEAWGHVVAKLLRDLPIDVPLELVDRGSVLDNFYAPLAIRTDTPRARPSSITAPDKARRRSKMPVRSLSLSVLRWPDRRTVELAVRKWARALREADSNVSRIGYAGSYARGDWGVGSDIDLIIVLHTSDRPFIERGRAFDATALPVPADVLVYVDDEWDALAERRRTPRPVVWVEL
jgi:HEPN domain-containing protein